MKDELNPNRQRADRPELPAYPGLPSRSGRTTAIFIRQPKDAATPPTQPEKPQEVSTEGKEDKAE